MTHLSVRELYEIQPGSPQHRWLRDDFALFGGTLLYRIWSADRILLYVGVSQNPFERLRTHAQNAPWWPHATLITYQIFRAGHDALAAERTAIRTEAPLFNKRSAVSSGPSVGAARHRLPAQPETSRHD
jgi:hypothetical protein